jgi:hypothetical protein
MKILQKKGPLFTLKIERDEDFEYILTVSILGVQVVMINLNDIFENITHKKPLNQK